MKEERYTEVQKCILNQLKSIFENMTTWNCIEKKAWAIEKLSKSAILSSKEQKIRISHIAISSRCHWEQHNSGRGYIAVAIHVHENVH